ncbi:hypothetical protein F8568_000520 [Actinomadura sp. LD22]|uniref:Uncharacterized protein n=1 Tax=Actinomadura physcomitrii TaxID=2650748 RepID=A0A6I4M4W5_9ACTN|nr:hypothetical protein [Actinomadura physcomitrii]MVZ98890.1 hypothetical protein [Actinomadura physcomitrii]
MQEGSFRLTDRLPSTDLALSSAPGLRRAAMEVSRQNPAVRGFDNRLAPKRSALRGV